MRISKQKPLRRLYQEGELLADESNPCYICGTNLSEGEAVCPACGAEQEMNQPCPNCSTPIPAGEPLCPGCGQTISWEYDEEDGEEKEATGETVEGAIEETAGDDELTDETPSPPDDDLDIDFDLSYGDEGPDESSDEEEAPPTPEEEEPVPDEAEEPVVLSFDHGEGLEESGQEETEDQPPSPDDDEGAPLFDISFKVLPMLLAKI